MRVGLDYFLYQRVDVAGFEQVIVCALGLCFSGGRHRAMSGKHDHRQIGVDSFDLSQRGMPIHTRHPDIQNDHIGLFRQFCDGLFTASGHNGQKSPAGQYLFGSHPELQFIVDHQHSYFLIHFLIFPFGVSCLRYAGPMLLTGRSAGDDRHQ